ncbi:hypothetical protein CHARACLAT_032375 [Characodon lateralis]|uniref:Uncharacterized protein n=1 Tax=Characodon lateralis TaxID=208331 RepID=A0ABU7DM45_9TELE|nr:hypothetical protein [Characodon lateralis]
MFYIARMSLDIKSTTDLLQRVRYSITKQGDTAEWEKKKVYIYNYINAMMDDSQVEGVKQTESQSAANKASVRCAALSRRLLYILILAGIISLTIYCKIKYNASKLRFSVFSNRDPEECLYKDVIIQFSPEREITHIRLKLYVWHHFKCFKTEQGT